MSKNKEMMDFAKYIAGGVVLGSAIGTAAAVMMKSKKHDMTKQMVKKGECIKSKAANAMDTVACVLQNIAEFTR